MLALKNVSTLRFYLEPSSIQMGFNLSELEIIWKASLAVCGRMKGAGLATNSKGKTNVNESGRERRAKEREGEREREREAEGEVKGEGDEEGGTAPREKRERERERERERDWWGRLETAGSAERVPFPPKNQWQEPREKKIRSSASPGAAGTLQSAAVAMTTTYYLPFSCCAFPFFSPPSISTLGCYIFFFLFIYLFFFHFIFLCFEYEPLPTFRLFNQLARLWLEIRR